MHHNLGNSYSIKIKKQTRKLGTDCSKHRFKVVDRTDEVSSKYCFEVVDTTDEVSNLYHGKPTLTWFEEIFESISHHFTTKSKTFCRNENT
ncbi:hypothetical protein [Streptococcus pneumoniae]|uniref:hypothetical protein n=1 Tax=Streptococcus pneumoniae TaxID=1313 RepID=UPI002180C873|nr:hypothetical protein [Streptococcus pneumoniae]